MVPIEGVIELGLVPFVGGLILIYFFVQKGTTGPNQFGEDPLPPAIAAT